MEPKMYLGYCFWDMPHLQHLTTMDSNSGDSPVTTGNIWELQKKRTCAAWGREKLVSNDAPLGKMMKNVDVSFVHLLCIFEPPFTHKYYRGGPCSQTNQREKETYASQCFRHPNTLAITNWAPSRTCSAAWHFARSAVPKAPKNHRCVKRIQQHAARRPSRKQLGMDQNPIGGKMEVGYLNLWPWHA